MNFYKGYIPDAPIDPPEYEPVCRCPRCHEPIFAGQEVYADRDTYEVLGCPKCIKLWEAEEE